MPIARVLAASDVADAMIGAACAALKAQGHAVTQTTALSHSGTGFEIAWKGGTSREGRALLFDTLGQADMLVADRAITRPALFVSDMDSTIIGQECIDELADYAGLKPQVARITERAMQGELDFVAALAERVRLLGGLAEADIATCLAERIRPNPGAACLLATLRAQGCRTVLVTGGFHHFADPVAEWLGFDHVVANRLSVRDGVLTGELTGSIVDAAAKRGTLVEAAARLAPGALTLAAGDGANDAPMLAVAELGIACHPKPAALAAANGAVWHDLTAILRLLDIPEPDWIAADT